MAVSAASGTPSHLPSLPPGLPPHAGLLSREQEMLQNEFYRRAYADPGLAHQVSLFNFQEFFIWQIVLLQLFHFVEPI